MKYFIIFSQLGSTNEAEVKILQDKLKQSEQKAAEFRNQCQSLRQELKVAQKVQSIRSIIAMVNLNYNP